MGSCRRGGGRGLEGKGGIAAHRQISTKELADYVIKRIEEIAGEQHASQEPQYFNGRDAEDYVLARWRTGAMA